MRATLLLVLIVSGLGACTRAVGVGSPAVAANRIAEAVLRHVMDSEETGVAATGAAAVCVALGPVGARMDPDSLFLARFKDMQPPPRPWSECALDIQHGDRLTHVRTGEPAVGYTVERPRYVSARRVFVSVAYYVAALDAAGYVCEVAMHGSDWRVDSCKRRWIT